MGKSFGFRFLAVATVLTVAIIQVDGAEMGTIACTNGKWVPDAKLIAFGLTCPLPLDGTTKSKGKTVSCAFKKLGIFDGTTVEKDKIPGAVCPVFSNADLQKQCKQQVQSCLKDGKGYFKSPKEDKDYKTWATPFQCIQKWASAACKK